MLGAARLCLIALSSAVLAASSQAEPKATDDESLTRGYELAYNLDHQKALEVFKAAIAERPDDPAGYRSVSAITWLRILFLRGTVLVDDYMAGSVGRPSGKAEKPPENLDQVFRTNIQRAIELAEKAVRQSPDDPDAHYEVGAALGLAASYTASVDGQPLRALRNAKRAVTEHKKVLKLDPNRKDANLIPGIYRYMVSILPTAPRLMAYFVGFDGGKEDAIRMIKEAAAYPSEAQTEAKFALVLLYNREEKYGLAQDVLSDLKRRYPRNRLVWLESASTWLRDDRTAMAELTLFQGFTKLAADDRTRMFGEEAVWRLKRGTARLALDRIADAGADLAAARDAEARPWVNGRAHVELGKIADLHGNRPRALEEYTRGRELCRKAKDKMCIEAAEALKKDGYPDGSSDP